MVQTLQSGQTKRPRGLEHLLEVRRTSDMILSFPAYGGRQRTGGQRDQPLTTRMQVPWASLCPVQNTGASAPQLVTEAVAFAQVRKMDTSAGMAFARQLSQSVYNAGRPIL